jgi:hypothetical protein
MWYKCCYSLFLLAVSVSARLSFNLLLFGLVFIYLVVPIIAIFTL